MEIPERWISQKGDFNYSILGKNQTPAFSPTVYHMTEPNLLLSLNQVANRMKCLVYIAHFIYTRVNFPEALP